METVALSSKGQFVLTKSIRDLHHWGAGTRFVVIDRGSEVVLKPAAPFAPTAFESPDCCPVGMVKRLSLAEMEQAIAAEAGKNDRH